MLYYKYVFLFILSYLVFSEFTIVYGIIDPITGTLAFGAFLAGYLIHKTSISNSFINSCPRPINFQCILDLQNDMNANFFGQHIASDIILSALKGNLHRSNNNKKPLVMSFHGWSGSGKNFVTELIANHLFNSQKIKNSRYHIFHGEINFPIHSKLNEYKRDLYNNVKSAINSCGLNMFVFDELQNIPMGLLDVLIPILENNDVSIDSRNSIFIFLTNAGSDIIVDKYLNLWKNGYSREEMKVVHFDSILQTFTFNEIGGLKKSQIIDSHIIDHYVPFLPLEKKHVMQCIEVELRHMDYYLSYEEKNGIMEGITFGPNPQQMFSLSGCKRINALVSSVLFKEL